MSRFIKITGESAWVNVDHIDAVIVRPQLRAIGAAHGQGTLEELHEVTGKFEVALMFQGQLTPMQTFDSREAAENFVQQLLQSLP